MNESIFKSTLRRFFIVLATVLGVLVAFMLVGQFSSAFDTDDSTGIKRSLSTEIQPNALGVRKKLASTSPVILQIRIDGMIGTDSLNRRTVEQQLLESREAPFDDDRVKGIILTINSPGGTVTDSDSIYRALKTYKEQYKVPIYAHVNGLCASGGLCIACAADKIYSTDSSIVGSVGVVGPPIFNFTELMGKMGVISKTLIAGKGKDELNPFRPWKPDEGQNYQLVIDAFYNIFVDIVASNRNRVDKEKLIADYGANVFPAHQAFEMGFTDSGDQSYNQTLALLAEEIGLKEEAYQVVRLHKENWLQSLFKGENAMELFKGNINCRLEIPGQLDPKLAHQFLYLYGASE